MKQYNVYCIDSLTPFVLSLCKRISWSGFLETPFCQKKGGTSDEKMVDDLFGIGDARSLLVWVRRGNERIAG